MHFFSNRWNLKLARFYLTAMEKDWGAGNEDRSNPLSMLII